MTASKLRDVLGAHNAHDARGVPSCPGPASVQTRPTTFEVPAGMVDAHAHVIGEPLRYPWVSDRAYTPPPAAPAAYLKMLNDVGSQYGVLIQVSVHGQDNTLMLDTLRAHPDRLRGVVVPALGLPDAQYQAMKDAGTVGLRLNVLHSGGGTSLAQLAEYDALARDWGWHMQVLLDARELPAHASGFARLKSTIVVDHMGHLPAAEGIASPAFRHLLALVRDGAWVKLSGAYRVSAEEPPYRDTLDYAQALIDAAPGRCVWGSDWPHVATWTTIPTVAQLLDTLSLWAPDSTTRTAILTTNAHKLYGFR